MLSMVEYQFEGSKVLIDHHFHQVSCNLLPWLRRSELRVEGDKICYRHLCACKCYYSTYVLLVEIILKVHNKVRG